MMKPAQPISTMCRMMPALMTKKRDPVRTVVAFLVERYVAPAAAQRLPAEDGAAKCRSDADDVRKQARTDLRESLCLGNVLGLVYDVRTQRHQRQ